MAHVNQNDVDKKVLKSPEEKKSGFSTLSSRYENDEFELVWAK